MAEDGSTPDDVGIGLDLLIALVRSRTASDDPIPAVSEAVQVAERLGELGDHLVGHFVDEARAAGASWQAIGTGMGVTKQAAQKRFVPDASDVPDGGLLRRFAPRARAAVDAARTEARRLGRAHVGSEHLLLGLVGQREGLAVRALAAVRVTPEQVRQQVAALPDDAAGKPMDAASLPERIPYGARAKKVLEVAVREALRRGHNYIGTEHLLLGVIADADGAGGRVLRELGVTRDGIDAWFRTEFAALVAEKTSKRRT